MQGGYNTFIARLRSAGALNTSNAEQFWDQHFLPRWLPLILGMAFGVASAFLIAQGQLVFLVPLAGIIPALILFLRYPFAAVIIWMLLFPYFVQEPFPAARYLFWVLHRLMIPGALGIVILSDWLGIRKRPPVRLGRAELALVLFLVLVTLNIVLTAADTTRTLIRCYDRIFVPFLLYFLIRLIQPTADDWRRLAWAGMITVIGEAIVGMIGWFSPQLLPETWLGREGERTTGTFGNPAVYTSTLIFLALILFQYAMQKRSRGVRVLALANFSLAYFCVFFSFSRGSWLGGVLVLMGMVFLYPKVIISWGATAVMVGLLVVGTLFGSELSYANQRLNDEDTAQGRVLGASTAYGLISSKPLFGWGFGNYDVYDEQFKVRALNLAVREDQTSHNTFLLIASEMGIIGLFLYLFPTFWLLSLSRKVWRRMPNHGFLSWGLLALLWLLILDHFTVSNFMEMIHSNLFGTSIWWIAHALIASLIYPYVQERDVGVPDWIRRYEQRSNNTMPAQGAGTGFFGPVSQRLRAWRSGSRKAQMR
jgi:O-antigen ligase